MSTHGGDPLYLDDRQCCVPKCSAIIPDNAPVPVCRDHGLQIARVYSDALAAEHGAKRARARERHQAKQGNREGSVVYYIRIGDYIKIGYTTRLGDRIKALRVSRDDVLAVEPGGREVEAMRHAEFAVERLHRRRENFHPSERLAAHIEGCLDLHGLPRWLSLPDTGTVRHGRVT